MCLIDNIKKNILSKFVNTTLYSHCCYKKYKRFSYSKLLEEAHEKNHITEINIKNINKSNFCSALSKTTKKHTMFIKIINNKHSNLAITKNNELLLIKNDGVLYEISNNESQIASSMVKIKPLGYLHGIKGNNFGEFIKIVDNNEFSKQIKATHKIELMDHMFFFDKIKNKHIVQIEKENYNSLDGEIDVINNRLIIYKPHGSNIAITIGRFVFNEKSTNINRQIGFIKEDLPANLHIKENWHQVFSKNKQPIQQHKIIPDYKGMYVNIPVISCNGMLEFAYKHHNVTNMDISDIKPSDFNLKSNCEKIVIKCLNNKTFNLVKTKNHEVLYLNNDGYLVQLSKFKKTQEKELVQCRLLGHVEIIKEKHFCKFSRIVDYKEFSAKINLQNELVIKLNRQMFQYDIKKKHIQLKQGLDNLNHGKLHIVNNQFLLYEHNESNILINMGEFDFGKKSKSGKSNVCFKKCKTLPQNFNVLIDWKKKTFKNKHLNDEQNNPNIPIDNQIYPKNHYKTQSGNQYSVVDKIPCFIRPVLHKKNYENSGCNIDPNRENITNSNYFSLDHQGFVTQSFTNSQIKNYDEISPQRDFQQIFDHTTVIQDNQSPIVNEMSKNHYSNIFNRSIGGQSVIDVNVIENSSKIQQLHNTGKGIRANHWKNTGFLSAVVGGSILCGVLLWNLFVKDSSTSTLQ